jgi:hypothetical protein
MIKRLCLFLFWVPQCNNLRYKYPWPYLKYINRSKAPERLVISNRNNGGRALIHVQGVHPCALIYSGVELFDMTSFFSFPAIFFNDVGDITGL